MATYWKVAAHSAYEVFSWYKYLIVNIVFSPPRFLECESLSDCAFFLIFAYLYLFLESGLNSSRGVSFQLFTRFFINFPMKYFSPEWCSSEPPEPPCKSATDIIVKALKHIIVSNIHACIKASHPRKHSF